MKASIIIGDCEKRLKNIPDNSIDSIVTDPPYGISFRKEEWDYNIPSVSVWRECLRVLKPGGHILVFASTRTQHRMACFLEDAGFEIRDVITWIYSGGLPKSSNVGRAIDASGGDNRDYKQWRVKLAEEITRKRKAASMSRKDLAAAFPEYSNITSNWERKDVGGRTPTPEAFAKLVKLLNVDKSFDKLVRAEDVRKKIKTHRSRRGEGKVYDIGHSGTMYRATTELGRKWESWGSCLRPAAEMITMARKPFKGSLADNVLNHSTGAINVDACRFGDGRYPSNVLHDGSIEERYARYFYCGKASNSDRGKGNNHPTVKPTRLMRYLVRMVTPPGGVVLDPFAGSGSTGKAALREGFIPILIERHRPYVDIIKSRLPNATVRASKRVGRMLLTT